MNDILKIRGRNSLGFVYGFPNFVLIRNKRILCIYDGKSDCIINEDSIERYTGICDSNGKEIYEGDIIKITEEKIDGSGYSIFNIVVKWNKDAMAFMACAAENQVPMSWFSNLSDNKREVIGNIHENPELLDKDYE